MHDFLRVRAGEAPRRFQRSNAGGIALLLVRNDPQLKSNNTMATPIFERAPANTGFVPDGRIDPNHLHPIGPCAIAPPTPSPPPIAQGHPLLLVGLRWAKERSTVEFKTWATPLFERVPVNRV